MPEPLTVLCLASYFKGEEFLRECKRRGCRVVFITAEKLAEEPWPRESIDELLLMPDLSRQQDVLPAVSYLARTRAFDRIVPLDEFDLDAAAALREHLRVPGMGETTARYFRDKLAMRLRARERGILVPDFTAVFNDDAVRFFAESVPAPYLLKPRSAASAIGIKRVERVEELWALLEGLGDRRSEQLLERFVPGDIYHVDTVVSEREVVFGAVHRYGAPPLSVMHEGGLFMTRTVERGAPEAADLRELTGRLTAALGFVRGVMHTEFIRGREDGRFYFLETAARVAGAHIAEVVEAATGVNLWREWARIETASAEHPYRPPEDRGGYAGAVISLARQEWPDTSAYDDAEIVWRLTKRHHAGLIVASEDAERVSTLLACYAPRFRDDFYARMPPP